MSTPMKLNLIVGSTRDRSSRYKEIVRFPSLQPISTTLIVSLPDCGSILKDEGSSSILYLVDKWVQ